MSLPVALRRAAQSEYDDAAAWYEKARAGLGIDFVAEVERIFATIAIQPDQYPIVFKGVREAPLHRFPYCVYYRASAKRIVVLAVFHTSRNPSIWQARA